VNIFHTKLADVSVAEMILARAEQNASANSSHLDVIQFIPEVTAQRPETMNLYRMTSYTKVKERKVIS
jgi:hypothetical protein